MRFLSDIGRDARLAIRGWKRAPGFALAAILTLALGIGANAAIFSIVNSVLLRPLPFADPGTLVQLSLSSPAEPGYPPTFSMAGDLDLWRRGATSLAGASTYSTFSQHLRWHTGPEQVATVRADRSLFGLLGTDALVGRTFHDGDPEDVVVVSYGFWQHHFAGDRGAIGQTITLDNRPFTLIGVMPEEFEFPFRTTRTDLWTPWVPSANRNSRLDAMIGRLRPGVSVDAARSELSGLSARPEAPGRRANVTPLVEYTTGAVRRSLFMLLGAVGFVLLVACANVANLLLARATARRRDVAVRVALGAGRARLVRQFLTESVLLAFAGGVVGAAVGIWMLPVLRGLASGLPRSWAIGVDWRVFAFLLAACAGTGIVFGLAPALHGLRRDVQRDLKSGERGSVAPRLRDGLVVTEIAVAFVLLVGAALLARTLINLQSEPAGFDADGVVTIHVVVPDAQTSHALVDRVAQVPGVTAAGFTSLLPLQNSNWNGRFRVTGRTIEGAAEFRYITPDYFRAIGVAFVRGRAFTAADTSSAPKVLLINDAFARKYFPGEDPVGQELHDRGTIIGVVGDVRQASLDRPAEPELYYPVAQNFAQLRSVGSVLVVRSAMPADSLLTSVRQAISEVSPDQPTFRAATLREVVSESLGSQRFYLTVMGVFAMIGTALAAAGIYGVVAYSVALRTREFGIRLALGADGRRVIRLVVRRGALLVGAGLTLGAIGAVLLARFLSGLLYGVTPTDVATMAGVASVLAAVAMTACFIPARRAGRVDPVIALRAE